MIDPDYIEGMQPEEHVKRAAEYVGHADGFMRRSDGTLVAADVAPLEARIIEAATRLATVHLQMASTKSLLESMPGRITSDLKDLVEQYTGPVIESLVKPDRFAPEPTNQYDGTARDNASRLPTDFTMTEWRAIKEYIHRHLEDQGNVWHAIPHGNRFLGEKMIQTAKRWAETFGKHVEYRIDSSDPSVEPTFKAWVRGSQNAPTNQYGETEADVLGEENNT
jgi:hypothetical protein